MEPVFPLPYLFLGVWSEGDGFFFCSLRGREVTVHCFFNFVFSIVFSPDVFFICLCSGGFFFFVVPSPGFSAAGRYVLFFFPFAFRAAAPAGNYF